MDINHPKMRWAQQVADKTQKVQVIVKNFLGDYDIKPASSVVMVNNPDLMFVIEPDSYKKAYLERETIY